MKKPLVLLGAVLLFAAAPFSLQWSPANGALSLSIDQAEARIGRPLTPGSIAGVHRRVYRRTARRAYYGGGYYGGGGSPYYGGAYYGGGGYYGPARRYARRAYRRGYYGY